ncbi:MAG: rhomboid family intramembrane serine protease [Roseiflexus sp.]|nr:rhomboid family intramembrane serine protease [Roseiflexus sp.]MCS7290302.1 rhomboid family intramembrane serine protease [Roseiflexus sp.]MDW8146056.1 rhomboid family intramembrane serine protease [Roseiflexaceae bacterium]MDW8231282.1 rhomboid family intramembrane serine protease [Roseiflexaceae bacterium]
MNNDKNDAEYQRILQNLETAGRTPEEPAPAATEPQTAAMQVRFPLFTPRVAPVLLAINVVVFVAPWLLDRVGVRIMGAVSVYDFLLIWGAKDNAAIFAGGQYYRFLTAMVLHGGLAHLLFNSFALYSLGFETERLFGAQRFLAIYMIAGLGGGVASYALNPNPSVGASGAIFGLVGALIAFYIVARRALGGIARQQLGSLIFITLINLALGFTSPYIDNNAHIGGLLTGALLGWLLAPRFALDTRSYPFTLVRLELRVGWPLTVAVLVALFALIATITPPL